MLRTTLWSSLCILAFLAGCTTQPDGPGAPVPDQSDGDVTTNGTDSPDIDDGTGGQGGNSGKAVWSAAFDASHAGALSSVWGSAPDDVFIVGGKPEQGEVYHYDGFVWRKMVVPQVGLLVWVYGFGPDDVFSVGVDGSAVRYDGVTWTALDSGTTQDLWGVWGSAPDDIWVVGGNVGEGDPTILHYDGDTFTRFPMPVNDRNATSLFKVWGIGSKVFAVGERGIIVQFADGEWSQVPTGPLANDDFVSLWGTSESNIVAVGGRVGARIATYDGSNWTTIAPPGMPGLSAVCTADPQLAVVGGVGGFVGNFNPTTGEITEETSPTDQAVHGAWADGQGRYYAVGGRFSRPYSGIALVRTNGDPGFSPTLPLDATVACATDDDCLPGNSCDAGDCVPLPGCSGTDVDTDGWLASCDNCPTTDNPDQADSDVDGVGDACDVCPGSQDGADADGDGVPDGCDQCFGFDDALDADTDGVPNGCDQCPGFDDHIDSDGDGMIDGCDICPGFDDLVDSDGDGVPNGCDLCPGANDALDADTDGVPNACDKCVGFDDHADADGDGVADGCDICPGFNDATDADHDGVPDLCDICPGGNDHQDSDNDGTPNFCDICPGFNDLADTDGDGVPNGCDDCAGDDTADDDGDGVPDACDVCEGQDDTVDSDADGQPDGCDICPGFDDMSDADGDGVPDGCDVCPGFDDDADSDGDGKPNACDPCPADNPDDSDSDGVCDSDDECPGFNDATDSDGDGAPNGCDLCPGFNDNLDSDGDGVPNGCDACPGFNDNTDADGDSVPNGCDACPGFNDLADSDGDGVPDGCDECPGHDDDVDNDGNGIPDGCCEAEAHCLLGETCFDGICTPVATDIELGFGNPYQRILEGGNMPLFPGFQGFGDLYLSYRTKGFTANGIMSITLTITMADDGTVIHPTFTDSNEEFVEISPGVNERLNHYWIIVLYPYPYFDREANVVVTIRDNANPQNTVTLRQRVKIVNADAAR